MYRCGEISYESFKSALDAFHRDVGVRLCARGNSRACRECAHSMKPTCRDVDYVDVALLAKSDAQEFVDLVNDVEPLTRDRSTTTADKIKYIISNTGLGELRAKPSNGAVIVYMYMHGYMFKCVDVANSLDFYTNAWVFRDRRARNDAGAYISRDRVSSTFGGGATTTTHQHINDHDFPALASARTSAAAARTPASTPVHAPTPAAVPAPTPTSAPAPAPASTPTAIPPLVLLPHPNSVAHPCCDAVAGVPMPPTLTFVTDPTKPKFALCWNDAMYVATRVDADAAIDAMLAATVKV